MSYYQFLTEYFTMLGKNVRVKNVKVRVKGVRVKGVRVVKRN